MEGIITWNIFRSFQLWVSCSFQNLDGMSWCRSFEPQFDVLHPQRSLLENHQLSSKLFPESWSTNSQIVDNYFMHYKQETLNYLLCISTSFGVQHAPKSWSENIFCFQTFFYVFQWFFIQKQKKCFQQLFKAVRWNFENFWPIL